MQCDVLSVEGLCAHPRGVGAAAPGLLTSRGIWWALQRASKQGSRERVAWIILFIAGLLEVGWAVGLKYTQGFTRLGPSLITVSLMALSFLLLSWAMRSLPLGTAYAVWTGIGTLGTVVVGVLVFGEPATLWRLGCIALILTGILGLKLAS